MPEREEVMSDTRRYQVVCLPGDGIGPEVIREAVKTVDAVGRALGFQIGWEEQPIGGASIDLHGVPLTDEVLGRCRGADAVLLGAVGGPRWDNLPPSTRPETGLLGLRKALGVFANLRPVTVTDSLANASPLKV
jgi:3-isopropylmalate dehydrogenase